MPLLSLYPALLGKQVRVRRTQIATCTVEQRGYNRGHTFEQLTISKECFT